MPDIRSIDDINKKIRSGEVVVATAPEMREIVAEKGAERAAKEIDVVTTGTFGMTTSSGAFLNFGHSDPQIKMGGGEVLLNDVPAYAGLSSVDTYIGATQLSKVHKLEYGGAHVIEDLVSGKSIDLKAYGSATQCHPIREIRGQFTISDLNQAIMVNPRSFYQRYSAATNSSDTPICTYLGTLLPNFGNVSYFSVGAISPLYNDPSFETIGIGTRILLAGGVGYVIGEGTLHDPKAMCGSLMVKGDLKKMNSRYLRGAAIANYGTALFIGAGVPIPILNSTIAKNCGITDEDIKVHIYDYHIPTRVKPLVKKTTYKELRSGKVAIGDRTVKASGLSSMKMAVEIIEKLKGMIEEGEFFLTKPVERITMESITRPMKLLYVKASDVMSAPVTCSADDSLRDAEKLMLDKKAGYVVVIDKQRHMQGVLTSWDVAKSIVTNGTKVKDVMTSQNIKTSRKDEPVEVSMRKLEQYRVRGLPVVDEEGKVLGVVRMQDLKYKVK
ncbi:MAG: homocysteine biosynthesis protein [Candidatus Micrarchaeota archaeon]|nr:homocysteine biosynthesis protein [Candidatus Micrarchaeota archaeon]